MACASFSRFPPYRPLSKITVILRQYINTYCWNTPDCDKFEHLKNLQGKMHRLVTGVSIVYHGEIIWSFVDQVNLEMRSLSDKFISEYLEIVGPEIFSTVGSYRLEGHGVQLFNQVKGDFFTVLGLPVLPLLTFLRLKNFMVS